MIPCIHGFVRFGRYPLLSEASRGEEAAVLLAEREIVLLADIKADTFFTLQLLLSVPMSFRLRIN